MRKETKIKIEIIKVLLKEKQINMTKLIAKIKQKYHISDRKLRKIIYELNKRKLLKIKKQKPNRKIIKLNKFWFFFYLLL